MDSVRKIFDKPMPAETFTASPSPVSLSGMAPHRAERFRAKLVETAERLTAQSAENAERYRQACVQRAKKFLVEFGITSATADAIVDLLKKEAGS